MPITRTAVAEVEIPEAEIIALLQGKIKSVDLSKGKNVFTVKHVPTEKVFRFGINNQFSETTEDEKPASKPPLKEPAPTK